MRLTSHLDADPSDTALLWRSGKEASWPPCEALIRLAAVALEAAATEGKPQLDIVPLFPKAGWADLAAGGQHFAYRKLPVSACDLAAHIYSEAGLFQMISFRLSPCFCTQAKPQASGRPRCCGVPRSSLFPRLQHQRSLLQAAAHSRGIAEAEAQKPAVRRRSHQAGGRACEAGQQAAKLRSSDSLRQKPPVSNLPRLQRAVLLQEGETQQLLTTAKQHLAATVLPLSAMLPMPQRQPACT